MSTAEASIMDDENIGPGMKALLEKMRAKHGSDVELPTFTDEQKAVIERAHSETLRTQQLVRDALKANGNTDAVLERIRAGQVSANETRSAVIAAFAVPLKS